VRARLDTDAYPQRLEESTALAFAGAINTTVLVKALNCFVGRSPVPCARLDTEAYLQRLEECAALGDLTDRHIAQQLQRGARIVSSLQQVRGLLLPSLPLLRCSWCPKTKFKRRHRPPHRAAAAVRLKGRVRCPAGAQTRLFLTDCLSRQRQPASDRIR